MYVHKKATFQCAIALLLWAAGTAHATPITYTLVMTPDTMVANPFGLTEKPTQLYAYFTFDDLVLGVNGSHRNVLSDFDLSIGNTSWVLSDIQSSQFTVQDNVITEVSLSIDSAGGNNNFGVDIQGVSNNYEWDAYNGYDRPTPKLMGSYTIVKGRAGGGSVVVPEPASMALFLIGLGVMRLRST